MTSPPPYRGRFAPSPTGPLHFGSLFAALGSWLLARHARGEWWVRMEDLDPLRQIQGAAAHQLQTLHRFGLVPDAPVSWQSQRSARYQVALDQLLADGHAFHCHCSRSDLANVGGIHRRCVGTRRRQEPAVRFRVTNLAQVAFADQLQGRVVQDVDREVGDFVLKRADGCWAYQLAVVVDDAAQGITDIVRGADMLDSTPRQILLQRALGLPTPRYLHLPVLMDSNGNKLSKSAAAPAVDTSCALPALSAAWGALGQRPLQYFTASPPGDLLKQAVRAFDLALLPRTRSIPVAALHNNAEANAV